MCATRGVSMPYSCSNFSMTRDLSPGVERHFYMLHALIYTDLWRERNSEKDNKCKIHTHRSSAVSFIFESCHTSSARRP